MRALRKDLLEGRTVDFCSNCHYEDANNNLSGRKMQLFRSKLDSPDSDFTASPHINMFEYSDANDGHTLETPIDLQVDLENTCNASCIMCVPKSSSRVKADHVKLHKIIPELIELPGKEDYHWAANQDLLSKFASELSTFPNLDYMQLLGGEPFILDSFFDICEQLISTGKAKQMIIGTTINCSILTERALKIIPEFKGFHLGLSIEAVGPLNDYVRYPSMIGDVLATINAVKQLKDTTPSLALQVRITPNIFTIYYIDELIQFILDNNLHAETCHILYRPSWLRVELLPPNLRQIAIDKLNAVAVRNGLIRAEVVANQRDKKNLKQVQSNTVYGFIDLLTNFVVPDNVEQERRNLVKSLMAYESLRKNSILDYAPEFTDFLKKYGY
jgi:MoaA/NifB/PqqE/SkfB family radical SAM enzyme